MKDNQVDPVMGPINRAQTGQAAAKKFSLVRSLVRHLQDERLGGQMPVCGKGKSIMHG